MQKKKTKKKQQPVYLAVWAWEDRYTTKEETRGKVRDRQCHTDKDREENEKENEKESE